MPVDWPFARSILLGKPGSVASGVAAEDAERQAATAKKILRRLRSQPGVLLADEVGMGKTYVTMAVIASVVEASSSQDGPVVVMTPPALREKWLRDWTLFRNCYWPENIAGKIRVEAAETPTQLLQLLEDKSKRRTRIVFIKTGLFQRTISDPIVRLALLRFARSGMHLSSVQKKRLSWWASALIGKKIKGDHLNALLNQSVCDWHALLNKFELLSSQDDDPIPESLIHFAERTDGTTWEKLKELIRNLPGKSPYGVGEATSQRLKTEFRECVREICREWLSKAQWHSPLLVLDEAHHAKNDGTRLAKLFREDTEDIPLLKSKFDRMLFLTATPFQLEHRELVQILRSLSAARWKGARAPSGSRKDFEQRLKELQKALDGNQDAARAFDREWGRLTPEDLGFEAGDPGEESRVHEWFQTILLTPSEHPGTRLNRAYNNCADEKRKAEKLLRPWVIRHNRSTRLRPESEIPRRELIFGKDTLTNLPWDGNRAVHGLEIPPKVSLPFLLTARAQSLLTQSAGARAYFAEGLASSYEAFHHTRDGHGWVEEDDGLQPSVETNDWDTESRWYVDRAEEFIPSRKCSPARRMEHPKVKATVGSALSLWETGEKVLIFCFYRETARALDEFLKREVHNRILQLVRVKLKLPAKTRQEVVERHIRRLRGLLSKCEEPIGLAAHEACLDLLNNHGKGIPDQGGMKAKVLGILQAYLRSESYIARFLPLENPDVRRIVCSRRAGSDVLKRAADRIREALGRTGDGSNQTFEDCGRAFLEFVRELAQLSEIDGDCSPEDRLPPLQNYLEAVSSLAGPSAAADAGPSGAGGTGGSVRYRVRALVRRVTGSTKPKIRDQVMQGFNSPLFPQILISTSVMGEGVDLHRFCRHVIHHDLCWNPSTLEQRTGRVDRLRCWAESTGYPIRVYEPFLAGSADEKMFRVVRDRERWFNIVMGQRFDLDEAASEKLARRIPLPKALAQELTFDLSCWHRRECGAAGAD